jgi:hypothetical protein
MFCAIYATDIKRHAPSPEIAEVLELFRGFGAGVPARLLDVIGAHPGDFVNVTETLGGDG